MVFDGSISHIRTTNSFARLIPFLRSLRLLCKSEVVVRACDGNVIPMSKF